MKTSSGSDSGFTEDRAIGMVRSSVPQPARITSPGGGAVTRQRAALQGAALAATPSGFGASGLTATAADNQVRSAGRFTSSPTNRLAISLSAGRSADLRAAFFVNATSLATALGTTAPTSSLVPAPGAPA